MMLKNYAFRMSLFLFLLVGVLEACLIKIGSTGKHWEYEPTERKLGSCGNIIFLF